MLLGLRRIFNDVLQVLVQSLPNLSSLIARTRMNDQSWKWKEGKEPCLGLMFGKTTVIVLWRTAVFVTRDCDQW